MIKAGASPRLAKRPIHPRDIFGQMKSGSIWRYLIIGRKMTIWGLHVSKFPPRVPKNHHWTAL
ncbi:hypothetical protein EBB79_17680 [Parasedimentitalea marina]|uniref:Uncharacterized protein n=1 Tax=Parasedimentitalea marina TaxID=2483033 RepID=A0A3T0N661_9RHOB|nr:hypothetical protein EBB79_17680 [Parasedimentitalea marina]